VTQDSAPEDGSGIYQIRHLASGRSYVGSAVNLRKRWALHRWSLANGRHRNQLLQRAWVKYGANAFAFEIVELVSERTSLIEREQFWFDAKSPSYNICPVAGSSLGRIHTEETRAKISAGHLGKTLSPEHRAKLAAAGIGRVHAAPSAEARARMGAANKGKRRRLGAKLSPETRARISAGNRGHVHSPEVRARMSAAHKGLPSYVRSPETLARMSAAHKGTTHSVSDETRAKLRAANIGRVFTAEHCARISAAKKGVPRAQDRNDSLGLGVN
jgi:group I intron endonuclease